MPVAAKPAIQERSRRTRDALVDALDSLLREKAFDAIGIADIASRAGVSAASIYQRFSNKDAAVSILLELYMRRVEEWTMSSAGKTSDARAAPTLRAALLTLGVAAWRQFEALGYVMRPAYLYSRLRPELLGEQWTERMGQARSGFFALLNAHCSEIRRKDLHRAAGMAAAFYNMMFVGLLLHRDDLAAGSSVHAVHADPDAFAAELADFVMGYLATPEHSA